MVQIPQAILQWLWMFAGFAAVIVTFESAYFLACSAFGLTASNIAKQSATMWGYSSAQYRALICQCADGRSGMALLIFGFAMQIVAMTSGTAVQAHEVPVTALAAAVAVGVIALLTARKYRARIAAKLEPEVIQHLRRMGVYESEE